MRKLFFFILLGSGLFLTSCSESVNPEVIPPEVIPLPLKQFTIYASADEGVVLSPTGEHLLTEGDSMLFSFIVTDSINRSLESLKVNGNSVNSYPNKLYRVVGKNHLWLKASEDLSLMVKSTLKDSIYVMNGGWYLQNSFYLDMNVDSLFYEEMERTSKSGNPYAWKETFYAYPNNCWERINEKGEPNGRSYGWQISGKILTVPSMDFKIIFLDNKKMILDFVFTSGNINRLIYAHSPNPDKIR